MSIWNERCRQKAREGETKPSPPLKRTRIHPRSKKACTRQKEYMLVRDQFLRDNPFCAVCAFNGQKNPANQVHHIRGREGSLLSDITNFLAVDNECHQWIHANPIMARQLGFLGSKFRPVEEE